MKSAGLLSSLVVKTGTDDQNLAIKSRMKGHKKGRNNRKIKEKEKGLKSIGNQAFNFAEREGFEPPDRSHGQRFSRPPRSTTLPSLLGGCKSRTIFRTAKKRRKSG